MSFSILCALCHVDRDEECLTTYAIDVACWNIPMYLLKWHLYQAWQTCALERKIRCNSILNYTYGTSFLFDIVFEWPKKELLLPYKLEKNLLFCLNGRDFFWKLFTYPLPKSVYVIVMLLLQNILSKHLSSDLQSWKVERQYNISLTFYVFQWYFDTVPPW